MARGLPRGRPRVGKQADREVATASLLEAAEEVAAARGIEATTIAAIAERAGVAVGTLYNYFPDRDALFRSLFRMRRAQLLPALDGAARAARRLPFDRRLPAYLGAVLAMFEQHRQFLQVVFALDEATAKLTESKPAVVPAVTDHLVDIVALVYPEQAEVYARMIVGAMRELVRWRVSLGEPFADDADLIADLFAKGIRK